MRSGAGSLWPRSRRVVFFVDFAWCVFVTGLADGDFEGEVLCPFAARPLTPIPAATSSVRAKWVAFRTRIGFRCCAAGEARVSPCLLLIVVRRNYTGQEDRKNAVVLAAQNLENDVCTGLQLSNGSAVVVQRRDRIMVDFGNHIAAPEIQIIRGKAGGI